MDVQSLRNVAYLLAAVLFILDLKWMSHPRTAVRGNWTGALGMAIAIAATLIGAPMTWTYIAGGVVLGALFGWFAAVRIPMTSMPEMVGLFNGFGGAASVLVAAGSLMAVRAAHLAGGAAAGLQERVATSATGLIGAVTFFGSWVAFGKLAEFIAVKWDLKPWQKVVHYGFAALVAAGGAAYGLLAGFGGAPTGARPQLYGALVALASIAIGGVLMVKKDRFPGIDAVKAVAAIAALALCVQAVRDPENELLYWALVAVSGLLGVLLTVSIGGADMPVVIALLNSYSGLAGAATGFLIGNSVLIVAGALVGASGIFLTRIMCKAMNRSMINVLFGAMGPTGDTPAAEEVYRKVKATTPDEIAMMVDGASRVVIVPGYGMAVAQAQHTVRQLETLLEEKGITVDFAVHPVAGRMPGHMNVLLAEANVPYERLREMDDINQEMEQVDICIVLGANDVVNPMAETDPQSPIAGMPIIQAHKARTVIVIKRSLSPGFAGIPNPLFAADNTLMYFADGKKAILDLIQAIKAS